MRRLAAVLTAGGMLAAVSAGAIPPDAAGELDGWFSFDVGWDSGITYAYRQHLPDLPDLPVPAFPGTGTAAAEEPQPAERRPFELTGRIGGSLYLDGGWLGGNALSDEWAGAVRRARIYTRGEFGYWTKTEYKFEFGLENRRFFLNDFYLRWRPKRWVDTVKFGYFDPPMGFQALEASSERSLMELASPVAAFAPGLRLGLEVARLVEDPALTWSLSLSSVGQEQTLGNASSDPLRVVGRLVWRPWGPAPDDAPLLHLGASAAFAFAGGGSIEYRSRAESFLTPFLAETGDIDGDAAVAGFEAAWRDGPLSVQGETLYSHVRDETSGSRHFWGLYAQAGWVLTGENRGYDPAGAVFDRILPAAALVPRRGGWGCVEMTARASWLDLSDGSIEGGRLLALAVGPAWTWNRWVRVLAGYVFAHVADGPRHGSAHVAQVRLELVL